MMPFLVVSPDHQQPKLIVGDRLRKQQIDIQVLQLPYNTIMPGGRYLQEAFACFKSGVIITRSRTIRYWIVQHDGVIKWKHFPRYWPFMRGIHRSPVNAAHKGQWRGALILSLIYVWINGWLNNLEAGDLRRHHAHYNVTVMKAVFKVEHNLHFELTKTCHIATSYVRYGVSNANIVDWIDRVIMKPQCIDK